MKILFVLFLAQAVLAQITEDSQEDIDDSCGCSKLYLPVCASNGKTYGNECLFQCAKDYLHQQGEEITEVEYEACEENYSE